MLLEKVPMFRPPKSVVRFSEIETHSDFPIVFRIYHIIFLPASIIFFLKNQLISQLNVQANIKYLLRPEKSGIHDTPPHNAAIIAKSTGQKSGATDKIRTDL